MCLPPEPALLVLGSGDMRGVNALSVSTKAAWRFSILACLQGRLVMIYCLTTLV